MSPARWVPPQAALAAEKVEATGSETDRVGSLSQVAGVLGSQWGDEGKGKLVDILAKNFDIVARCQVIYECFF
jgi:adenylosuccinate synthase